MESTTEGVRLDALIASPPPKARQSVFPSRAGDSSGRTQKVGFEKSMMKSNLDQTQRVGAEKSVMRSNLDQTKKETQYKTATPKEIPHLSDAFGARTRRPESDAVRPSHGSSTKNKYQSSMTFGSRPGPRCIDKTSIKTAFTSAHDIHMASRQIQYETLTLPERKKQEEWAQKKLEELGTCPADFKWLRVPGGYNCSAGNHWMTDAMVTEGRGGYLCLPDFISGRDRAPDPLENLEKNRRIGFRDGLDKFHGPIHPSTDLWGWASLNDK
jgi:hypothetical protein